MMRFDGFNAAVFGVYFDDLALQFVVVFFGIVGVLMMSFVALSPLVIDHWDLGFAVV